MKQLTDGLRFHLLWEIHSNALKWTGSSDKIGQLTPSTWNSTRCCYINRTPNECQCE